MQKQLLNPYGVAEWTWSLLQSLDFEVQESTDISYLDQDLTITT